MNYLNLIQSAISAKQNAAFGVTNCAERSAISAARLSQNLLIAIPK